MRFASPRNLRSVPTLPAFEELLLGENSLEALLLDEELLSELQVEQRLFEELSGVVLKGHKLQPPAQLLKAPLRRARALLGQN